MKGEYVVIYNGKRMRRCEMPDSHCEGCLFYDRGNPVSDCRRPIQDRQTYPCTTKAIDDEDYEYDLFYIWVYEGLYINKNTKTI